MQAYDANYVTREGKLVIDDPEIRRRLIRTMDSYTAIYRKGCTPPDSVDLGRPAGKQPGVPGPGGRHDAERHALDPQRAQGASAPRTTTRTRHDRMAGWRRRPALAIRTGFVAATAFKAGGHVPLAKEFVRFLVGEGWLMPLSQLLRRALAAVDAEAARPAVLARSERPPPHGLGDPVPDPPAHLQLLGRLRRSATPGRNGRRVWAKAVHRVAAEGISPEQAVDEAIARIKEILSE